MSIEPFLASMPVEFREKLEVEDFVSTLITYLEQVKDNINNNEASLQTSEFFNDGFESASDQNSIPRTLDIDGTTQEVLSGQVANISNGGTALLDENPGAGYRVEVRNADGSSVTIDGNGRSINGSDSFTIPTQYTVRVIQYFIDSDSFGVI